MRSQPPASRDASGPGADAMGHPTRVAVSPLAGALPLDGPTAAARDSAYRRLALTILGVDVGTVADTLRSARL